MEETKLKSLKHNYSPMETKTSQAVGGGCYSQNSQHRARTIKQNGLNITGTNFQSHRYIDVLPPKKIQIKIAKKRKGTRQMVMVPQPIISPASFLEKEPTLQPVTLQNSLEKNIRLSREEITRPSSCLGGPSMHMTDSLIQEYISRGKLKLKTSILNSMSLAPIKMVEVPLPKKRTTYRNISKSIRTLVSTLQNSHVDLNSSKSGENLAPHYYQQEGNNLKKTGSHRLTFEHRVPYKSNNHTMPSARRRPKTSLPKPSTANNSLQNFNYAMMQKQVEECTEKFHVLYRLLASRRQIPPQRPSMGQKNFQHSPSHHSIGCGNTEHNESYEAAQHTASNNLLQLNLKASEIALRYQNTLQKGGHLYHQDSALTPNRAQVHICTLKDIL